MEKKLLTILKDSENSWWYKGRTYSLKSLLATSDQGNFFPVLDFGAGFGAMFSYLRAFGEVDGYEIDAEAAKHALSRGYKEVFTTVAALIKNNKRYSLIGAFDVVEHIEKDYEALLLMHALLVSDGVLLVSVPAYNFLWSEHDDQNHHFRRYTKKELIQLFQKTGFEIVRVSYWNTLLFPVAVIARLIFRKGGGEALTPTTFINALLTSIVFAESKILRLFSFPFGTGLVAVCKKKSS